MLASVGLPLMLLVPAVTDTPLPLVPSMVLPLMTTFVPATSTAAPALSDDQRGKTPVGIPRQNLMSGDTCRPLDRQARPQLSAGPARLGPSVYRARGRALPGILRTSEGLR
jgi:hypothetical protein